MNARFWIWTNGDWVKLTLKPGQQLSHHQFTPTDEGWSSRAEVFSFDGDFVNREVTSDGSDCDGRLTSYYDDTCPIDRLATVHDDCDDRVFPDWQSIHRHQRDYSAEAMGY